MTAARTLKTALALVAVAALAACGDKPQTLNAAGVKADSPAYQGSAQGQFVQRGWQPGDRASWEQQLRTRAAYGQNEYTRIN
jgi:predicted small lipoprotein YifL